MVYLALGIDAAFMIEPNWGYLAHNRSLYESINQSYKGGNAHGNARASSVCFARLRARCVEDVVQAFR